MFNTIKSAKTTLYSVCMTTDLWTSRSGDSYIAFTLQFLDEDFVMQHMTVDCQPFPGKHDCIAICDKVENVISELDLLDEKIKIYIVSDNGANNVKALGKNPSNLENDFNMTEAVNRKSWEHILCYNHTLQLTISDTRKEMSANGVIEKVSNIVARYNRSKSARESLEHFQTEHNIPKHDLIQMVCTRWDSEFLMLERFVEQKFAIISEQHKAGIDGLTVQEWKLIEGYVEVLRSIANFTAEMGSRSKPTLSMVLPVIFEIKSSLEDIIKNAPKGTGILFARKLLANIKLRFTDSKYWESPLYRIAMLLDNGLKIHFLTIKIVLLY
ncbi:zinc finger bed domain-containing protein 4-like protein [Lasius niger]|uniref:Zinc finger bed domain-containing protein 4-like protein n=1 Tax=Lasius niger TaxID=67767 RepID=A0A0J7N6H6_LASNI|nr:zinc finger bed domain-containing protein 4-like protein [Lasius niger]